MKALLSVDPGPPETLVLSDVAQPGPGEGEICIRVGYCAINFPDVLIIEDKYQVRPERPFAPGTEVSGTIESIGPGVAGLKPGDRVIAAVGHGGLAEFVTVAAGRAFLLPDWADAAEGSALLMTYATTIHALADRGQLAAGETLLVLGAAGGTGMSAIEIGKALGARVVAAVSSEEKAGAARAVGADATLVYDRGPFDKAESKALAGRFKEAVGPDGANVIYDPVGGDYCEPALRSIAWYGRYLVIGFVAGIPRLPLNLTLLKSCDVRGVFWGGFVKADPAHSRDNVGKLFEMWRDGKVRPRIERVFPLAEAGQAIAMLADRRAVGKLVVRVAQE